jgi:hypothetical protein
LQTGSSHGGVPANRNLPKVHESLILPQRCPFILGRGSFNGIPSYPAGSAIMDKTNFHEAGGLG